MTDSIRRQRQAKQQQQRAGAEKLRRARQDRKVEKLTGVQGMRFRDLVAAIRKEKGLTEEGARRNAQTLLDSLGMQSDIEQREQREQWRMKLVDF